jgi:hypothetical protein
LPTRSLHLAAIGPAPCATPAPPHPPRPATPATPCAGFIEADLKQELASSGQLGDSDVLNWHSMAPAYLRAQLARSLQRLNLEAVELLYLHNAAEMQLPALGKAGFLDKLRAAFT